MPATVAALAESLGARLVGARNVIIRRIAPIDAAGPDSIVFTQTAAALEQALATPAGAIIAGPFGDRPDAGRPILVCADPRLAFARAARILMPPAERATGVHPAAVVAASATLGDAVAVGPCAVVGGGVIIGDRTTIGPGVVLQPGVRVGADCHLVANVVVYSGTVIGDRVVIHAGSVVGSDGFGYVRDPASGRHELFPQVGTLEIEDDVEIGANTTIDRGALGKTVIGSGTKLDNLIHIAHNVRIGRNVVVAAQSGVAGSTRIDDDVVLAGQVGVADHAHVQAGVVLCAQTGVPSHKTLRGRGAMYWGTPARPIRTVMGELALLARMARRNASKPGPS